MAKIRLDQLLVSRGLVDSRAKAQAIIMGGSVMLGTTRLTKPGHTLPEEAAVYIEQKEHPWVSRGGMKLAKGLAEFAIDPAGRVCLDIGASTGGFTDVLLHGGAAKVYAVDVGHGQLDAKLRADPRVIVLEKTNARHLNATLIPEAPSLLVCDASFIRLETVLPAALDLAAPGATLLALIKPQFEAEKADVSRGKGVIRDAALQAAICERVRDWLAGLGWQVLGLTESPVTGPKGNREFLIAARRD